MLPALPFDSGTKLVVEVDGAITQGWEPPLAACIDRHQRKPRGVAVPAARHWTDFGREAMTHRFFRDPSGAEWQVWDACASSDVRGPVAPELAAGWLCFERVLAPGAPIDTPMERRRLAPIPPGWDALSDAELRVLLARAPAAARRSPTPPPDPSGRIRLRPR